MKKRDFLFIYPPSADPTIPPLSLARIKPLADRIFNTDYLDENIEFIYYVISRVIEENRKNKKDNPGYDFRRRKIEISLSDRGTFEQDILKAIAILKSGSLFYNIKDYVAAYSVIKKMFKYFSSIYGSTDIGYSSSKLIYSSYLTSDIKKAIMDDVNNPYIDFFKSRINNYENYRYIGISVIFTSQLIPALTLANIIKSIDPKIKIIFGGPASYFIKSKLMSSFSFIDLIVPFDGEFFLERCGVHLTYNLKDVVIDDNCFGFYNFSNKIPDYDFINKKRYLLPDSVINLDITRGCYYKKCVYCAYGFVKSPYRVMDMGKIVDYIEKLHDKFGLNHIFISVDVFDPFSLEKFARLLVERGLNIYYYLDARMEKRFTDNGFTELLYKSGCRVISFGMESVCNKTLERMGKGIDSSIFPIILKNLGDLGIHININLIYGFPGENRESLEKTFDFLLKNQKYIATVGLSKFTLLRNSTMEKSFSNFGISTINPHGDLFLFYDINYSIPDDYPDYYNFLNRILRLFPVFGRLTGSTSDYLLYASKYDPDTVKMMMKEAIKMVNQN